MAVIKKPDYRDKYLRVTSFDDSAKGLSLDIFAKTGRITDAASAAGVSISTIRSHLQKNPEFAQAWEIAQEQYSDHVTSLIEERAFTGIEEPIIGGRHRDEVVGHKRTYSDSLAVLHAKRYVPAYRERQQLDVSVSGGVLAVSSAMPNTANGRREWNSLYGGDYEPGSILPEPPPRITKQEDVIDVNPTPPPESLEGTTSAGGEAVECPRESDTERWGKVGEGASLIPEADEPASGVGDTVTGDVIPYESDGGDTGGFDGREALF